MGFGVGQQVKPIQMIGQVWDDMVKLPAHYSSDFCYTTDIGICCGHTLLWGLKQQQTLASILAAILGRLKVQLKSKRGCEKTTYTHYCKTNLGEAHHNKFTESVE